MKFYFAPMEGITLYPLRNVHHMMFGQQIDKYYTPFLTAAHTFHFKKREKRDVQPEFARGFENFGEEIVPQIMSGSADTFVWAAKQMKELGYNEVNLNVGCPAPTVTNRHKGAGLLLDVEHLDNMLSGIFDEMTDSYEKSQISVKTRLGFYDEEEATELMKVYAKYPIKELIIHARVREDFYRGQPRIDAYKNAVKVYRENGGKAEICYNGDITSAEDFWKRFSNEKPEGKECSTTDLSIDSDNTASQEKNGAYTDGYPDSVMIGRGLLANPALVREINGGEKLKPGELKEYLDRLYRGYEEFIPEERNVIFKMLEHWAFLIPHFENSEKYIKAIRKSRSKSEYMAAVNNIFAGTEFTN